MIKCNSNNKCQSHAVLGGIAVKSHVVSVATCKANFDWGPTPRSLLLVGGPGLCLIDLRPDSVRA